MKQIYAEKYRQIGLKIAYYRKLRGLTQEELAEQAGLTPAFVGHLEAPNIVKALSLDTLFDIAAVLDIPPHRFFLFEEG
ncbi:MAG: helix-turn-helix transcriptional regulator [Lachnospiraceae bacterium]|nr:helix-turn-helix transcriptional regulator [Lachnospiraceae bacterium]